MNWCLHYNSNSSLTRSMEITQTQFEQKKNTAKRLSLSHPLDSLGDFYRDQDGMILFKGGKYWAANRFFLFSTFRELIHYDQELEKFLPEEEFNEQSHPGMAQSESKKEYLSLELAGRRVSNLDALKNEIAEELDIRMESLDLSTSSLDLIDAALSKHVQADKYRLLSPFLAYVFMVIQQEIPNVFLNVEEQTLISESGENPVNVGSYLIDFLLQSDYGPSIWMVYHLAMKDLKAP